MSTITEKINEIIDRRKGTGGYEGKGRLNIIEQRKLFFEKLKKCFLNTNRLELLPLVK